jgi:lipopolysaccharide transport system ATP-binding protein
VCRHYNDFLDGLNASLGSLASPSAEDRFESGLFLSSNASVATLQPSPLQTPEAAKFAKFKDIQVWVDGHEGPPWVLKSQVSDLEIHVDFVCPLELPTPSVAILINDRHGKHITSCCNHYDQVQLFRNAQGQASLKVSFPRVHLLRGHFVLSVYLLCENALMIYDHAQVCELEVIQTGLELGVVALEREWSQP